MTIPEAVRALTVGDCLTRREAVKTIREYFKKERKRMRVRCDIEYCRYWSKNGGDYTDEGGCILDEIRISDDTYTAAGFVPMCGNYEEREDAAED